MIAHRPDRAAAVAAFALAVLAVAWAAVVVLAPRLAAAQPGTGRATMAALVYTMGSGICHQRPERSFASAGVRWPVCSRCAGIYLGAAAGVLAMAPFARRVSAVTQAWRWVVLLTIAPTLASWLLEVAGGPATPNSWRAVLAWPAGALVGAFLAATASSSASQSRRRPRG